MTVHTTHPHHISTRSVAAAFAGAVLAAGVGYGVAALALDEAPAPVEPTSVPGNPDPPTGLFPGTNREERALMHRLD